MKTVQKGFTLIELMIVVAIIAILAAIALPAYNDYRVKSAVNACLGEAKGAMNSTIAALAAEMTPPTYVPAACSAGTPPTAIGDATSTPITFTPKSPGEKGEISCAADSGTCKITKDGKGAAVTN